MQSMGLQRIGHDLATEQQPHRIQLERHLQRLKPTDLWLPREKDGGMEGLGFGINRFKLFCIGLINNKVLLYGTGNYTQYPVINYNGKEYEKECMYVYLNCFAE